MDKQGMLLCAKYAASPNFFGFCGPDENPSLVDHLKENIADSELVHILSHFETLFPYLQLIARKNKIIDPFDRRVVEAYWIGNQLLKPLTLLEYQAFGEEKLFLERKIKKEDWSKLKTKIDRYKFLPHHAFHVFNIFKRTGHNPSFHTLETMDNCRISWGEIKQYKILNIKNKKHISKIKYILVRTKPLTISDGRLELGDPIIKEINIDYKRKSFLDDLKEGEWVSFHWGMVCDRLKENQVKNLEFYTKRAIDFFNL